jgi:hypothetical protein
MLVTNNTPKVQADFGVSLFYNNYILLGLFFILVEIRLPKTFSVLHLQLDL